MADREPTAEDYKWAIQDGKLTDAENRELAGYFGIHWHEMSEDGYQCVKCESTPYFDNTFKPNPDFSDPILVLREMRKREDWERFAHYCKYTHAIRINAFPGKRSETVFSVDVNAVLDENHEDLLARAALDWMRREKV